MQVADPEMRVDSVIRLPIVKPPLLLIALISLYTA